MDWSINYLIRVRVSIHSPLTLHEDRADNKLKVSSAATISVSVGAPLTVRRPRTKLIGSFQHVLAQQLCVGPPGGKLLIQLVIDELLYPRTWITGDTEIVETEHKWWKTLLLQLLYGHVLRNTGIDLTVMFWKNNAKLLLTIFQSYSLTFYLQSIP